MPIKADEYANLEIRILEKKDQGYPVELTLDGSQQYQGGYLKPAILPWVPTASPERDGEHLFNHLFGDGRLKHQWTEIRGRHPQRQVRLRIDAEAPELHAIPWELLRDTTAENEPQTLAATVATPFSRYIAGQWQPGEPIGKRPIKILVAVSNPDNLSEYGLSAIDVDAEWRLIQEATDRLDVELVQLPQPCTLSTLETALKEGPHILHLIGHGAYSQRREQAQLYLADNDNRVALVPEADLAAMIRRQSADADTQPDDQLRLVFLASCQTASRSPADAFRGFAPALIQAGVPAVLAMQDLIPVETAREFSRAFYTELLEHGQVDRACNGARAALMTGRLPGSSIPVLFSRLIDNQLIARIPPITKRRLQERVLDAAIATQVVVGKVTDLIAMVRRIDSDGLKAILEIESFFSARKEDITSKPFQLEFPSDSRGIPQPVGLILKIDSPDFDPRSQEKKISVPPEGDSEAIPFLLTPKHTGELLLNLEVYKDDVYIASRILKTNGKASNREVITDSKMLVSIPLVVVGYWLELPVELQQAIDSRLASIRLGAVQELNELLQGSDEGLVLAIHDALKRLVDDDSLSVSAAAAEALGHVTEPAPSPVTPVEVSKPSPKTKPAPSIPDVLTISSPIQLELVRVPAGEFLMGSDPKIDKATMDDEQPQHTVFLPDYYVAKTPVTNAQYAAFVQATGYQTMAEKAGYGWGWTGKEWDQISGADWRHPRGPDSDISGTPEGISDKTDHPVVQIAWADAVAFCQWLSQETGRTVRLPTEAEWEKAARGTDGRIYPWGNEWDETRLNSYEGGVWDTTPVGRYSPQGDSPYGAVDMVGNVWEWCATKWGKSYPYATAEGEWSSDYLKEIEARVLRGGSWYDNRLFARCAARHGGGPDGRSSGVGCRVVVAPSS